MKIEADKKLLENRQKQIEKLQKEYDITFEVKQQMENMIKKYSIYEVGNKNF